MIEAIEGNSGTKLNVRCFLPAGGPQKNWDAFLLASFLQFFRGQIFLNKFWPWLFGHLPESSNSAKSTPQHFFLWHPLSGWHVARSAPVLSIARAWALGEWVGRHFGPDGQLTYTQNCVDFRYFLDVCDLWNSPNVVASWVFLLIQLGASPGLL